jgi:hypothetical protein
MSPAAPYPPWSSPPRSGGRTAASPPDASAEYSGAVRGVSSACLPQLAEPALQ